MKEGESTRERERERECVREREREREMTLLFLPPEALMATLDSLSPLSLTQTF